MKVLKFGGSSIASSKRIKNVIQIIHNAVRNDKIIVVVSAFGGVTDLLIETGLKAEQGDASYRESLAKLEERHRQTAIELFSEDVYQDALLHLKKEFTEINNVLQGVFLLHERSAKSADLISSFGERLSAYLISRALTCEGIDASYVDARKLIRTDRNYGHACVSFEETNARIRAYIESDSALPVVTGFIASANDDTTTTLGRGGSDYTAAILAGALSAAEIQIWTDVPGLMSADPRRVKEAYTLPIISYAEAMELSHAGAKVLHPYTVRPAVEQKIPLVIKNTFDPENPGTTIVEKAVEEGGFGSVKGISSVNDVVLVDIAGSGMVGVPGIASRLFASLAQAGINIIFISQASSEQSISLAINPDKAEKAKAIVEKEFASEIAARQIERVSLRMGMAIISIVGDKMCGKPGVSARLFETLGKNGVNVFAVAQGANEMNISVVVDSVEEDKALNCIHESFFLSRNKIHLFVAGTGTIASSLIRQIAAHRDTLRKELNLEIEICGLVNTRKMALSKDGISLEMWESEMQPHEAGSGIEQFIDNIRKLNLHNSIFVDCTASQVVAAAYPSLLGSNISVVTANKLGTAGSLALYQKICSALRQGRAKFLYETNVGAGLPIIGTLSDLKKSGDVIEKIEGVVSGTLSYIFTMLKTGMRFSEIIVEAKEAGYTEPDPREDLSGADFARKFLILARELGHKMNFEDIEFENLVPEPLRGDISVQEFLEKLPAYDSYFENLLAEAKANHAVLSYLGRLENGVVKIGLSQVPETSPIATLTGTENMISFTTGRYHQNPLIVKGPGAGAEVTAGGVFADILRISNYFAY
ncbi:aspartate kinase [Chloroherpeton thalassium ATCC 35110]|uniref:Aspartate kinase n=1 Tax=Chloroherpeton thalassium (strain ATCC 35110 / GB-78) TaxID=517418 RepID=B3QZD1_CHLT3|nr:bifunctional aspartate kinase/homoserine dehydrogenase I [Chloroherpeton thalassium]ACF13824.1 aspartate kinase [Chloroherpeton thalassium ATCC 35110]